MYCNGQPTTTKVVLAMIGKQTQTVQPLVSWLFARVLKCTSVRSSQRLAMYWESHTLVQGKNIQESTNHYKQMRVPFIICTDLEALNIQAELVRADNREKSYIRQIVNQVPCSYCWVAVHSNGETETPVAYRW